MDEIPVLHPHRHYYRLIIVAVMVGLSGLGLLLVRRAQTNGLFVSSNAVTTIRNIIQPSVTTAPVNNSKAFFSIKSDADLRQVYEGREVTLKLYGNSDGRSVQGFDALIKLSGVDYELVSVKSPDFDVIKFIKPTHLTVTAVKKINITRDVVLFPNEIVAEIMIKPKTDGSLTSEIAESVGKETSKMIFDDVSSAGGLQKVSATAQDE